MHKARRRTKIFVSINIARNSPRPVITENDNFETSTRFPPMRSELVYRDARKW